MKTRRSTRDDPAAALPQTRGAPARPASLSRDSVAERFSIPSVTVSLTTTGSRPRPASVPPHDPTP
jgi:hypothetical protein